MDDTDEQTTPKSDTPKKRGAPFGNKNAVGHGAPQGNQNGRGNLRHGLRTGKLPRSLQYVEHRCNELRRDLEDQLLAVGGEVNQKHAGTIWAIAKRYREVMLRERRMRQIEEGNKEWFEHLEGAADAAEKLVKLLDRLPLDRDAKASIVEALYAPRLPAPTDEGEESA